jgi:hypothetical protein
MGAFWRPDAPSVTSRFARRATSPVPLRCTGQEQIGASSLLPRDSGGGGSAGDSRRRRRGASGRYSRGLT